MKTELRSSIVPAIALLAGFLIGMHYQQRTDEHRLILAEWKKITSLNQLVDLRQQEIIKNSQLWMKQKGF